MSSDSHTPFDTPPPSGSEDATKHLPEDPGKTWVPGERDAPILGQTEDAVPPEETQPISSDSRGDTSESTRADLPDEPPRKFGEYELLETIGRGGMGTVFKARDCRLDRIVALKTLRVRTTKSEQQIERFLREAKAAARLDHPNIVPCYDSGEYDGWHYLTMAYVAGKSLQDRLADGPLKPEDAARLVHALAGAVAHAHHQGVIHRDIKPSNVLLDKDGRPRLTDFGIAKLIDGDLFSAPAQLTLVGQVLGTPGYMSPEQSAGRRWEVGQSADIYALGGVLSAALTGQSPGTGDTLPLDLPAELQAICNCCLAHRPQDRYASADDVVSALEDYLKGLDRPIVPVVPQTAESAMKPQDVAFTLSKTGLIKATGFIVLVLLCSVLLGTWLSGLWGQPGLSEGTPNSREEADPDGTSQGMHAATSGLIRSRLDVLVKRGEDIIPLESVEALPLRPEDQLEVDVRADRRENAFFYLVRIGTSQKATLENQGRSLPLSPPVPTPHADLPKTDFPVKTVATDTVAIDRNGPAGVMTLLLLARKEALPDSSRDELNRAFQSFSIQEPVLAERSVERFAFTNPGQTSMLSQVDLQPLLNRNPEPVPTTALVKTLLPYFERIEGVRFHVPAQHVPATAEPSSDRNAQP